MNPYEQKQEERRERLLASADKAEREAANRFKSADNVLSGIPLGQPILIGHHSERRHRAALERADNNMRKGVEAHKKAEHMRGRADGVGRAGVSSDDPDAIEKLREKLAELEKTLEQMKATNKALKKAFKTGDDQPLRDLGLSPAGIAALKVPDVCGGIGFQPYEMSNRSANIRRIKKRIANLEATADDTTTEKTFGAVRVVDSVEENRLQIFFPGKPDENTRCCLRGWGFRWSPTAGAWQRHRSSAATYWGEKIARDYDQKLTEDQGELTKRSR